MIIYIIFLLCHTIHKTISNTFFAKLPQEPTESETTTPEPEQSGRIPIASIVAAVSGSIIGVLAIVIVCVCVVCMTRQVHINVSCYKERRKSDIRKHSNISVQQTAAQKQRAHNKEPTDGKTMMEIPEQPMQFNPAYGLRGETSKGMETGSTGEKYVIEYIEGHRFGPTVREHERSSNLAMPMEHEVSVQQQDIEDNEHPYEYFL